MSFKSGFLFDTNSFQTFRVIKEETAQHSFGNVYHAKSDEDFDDGPLRIEEIEDDAEEDNNGQTEFKPPVEVVTKVEEVDMGEFNNWAQDILDMMDSSIAQLDSLRIKKSEFDVDKKNHFIEDKKEEVALEKKEETQPTRPDSLGLSKLIRQLKDEPKFLNVDDNDEDAIEKENDVNTLHEMLNTVYDYDTRRRIRKRIRMVNKENAERTTLEEQGNSYPDVPSPVKSVDEGYVSVSSPISPPFERGYDDFSKEFPNTKMGDYVNGVSLDEIEDEVQLHNLLDGSDDIEERKMIRNRLREVMAQHRAEREEMIRRREQDREDILRKRVADSDEHKRRTLAMYDAMAKSSPAGGNKNIDVSILRTGNEKPFVDPLTPDFCMKENYFSGSSSNMIWNGKTRSAAASAAWSSPDGLTKSYVTCHAEQRVLHVASAQPVVGHQKVDLVEEAIRDRQKACDNQKKLTLAAFDKAARSAPAGMPRIVDFDSVSKDDINKDVKPAKYSSCFEMRGGVPSSARVVVAKPLQSNQEPVRDLMEETIRKRQAECEERKRRTLAAYDTAARSRPAGQPVSVYIPTTDGVDPVVTVVQMHVSGFLKALLKSRKPFWSFARSIHVNISKPVAKVNLSSPSSIKEMLLKWVKSKTKEYQNISIDNFSSSWGNGLAFCALIHHFYPDAFDYYALNPKNRRSNFDLAFRVAEEKADIAPLLDVDDMVMMQNKPDWKCVFTYVQSFYRRFHNVE